MVPAASGPFTSQLEGKLPPLRTLAELHGMVDTPDTTHIAAGLNISINTGGRPAPPIDVTPTRRVQPPGYEDPIDVSGLMSANPPSEPEPAPARDGGLAPQQRSAQSRC